MPEPVTDAAPCVAVPPTVTSAPVKSLTDELNTTVKLTGLTLVGSAWPAAWLTVAVRGEAVAYVTVSSLDVDAVLAFPTASCAVPAATEATTVPFADTGTVTV